MEYYNNTLCISARELMAVMTESVYRNMTTRKQVAVARRACRGNYALVVVDSLPDKYKEAAKELYPEGSSVVFHEWLRSNYTLDAEARSFYAGFRFDDGGLLPPAKITEYTVNASVIRSVLRLKTSTKALRRAQQGGKLQWDELATAVAFFKQEYGHTLPENALRFRKKVSEFTKYGYAALISGKFGNQSSRKVNYKIERLLLSLDSLPERPFNTTVAEMYNQFVCGELDVYDPDTGELLNPDDFADKDGNPVALSETTVANYLNNPKNRALRSKLHDTAWDFNNRYRPHHNRKSPVWAFSKISLDDRDLPRPMIGGNRVKAYYAYDVASGCVIGYAHNRFKTAELFIDCVRNMFRLIDRQGWNCPAEAEVEHHIVRNYADDLMRANVIFPFVRWCNPGNSREKRAEHFNRAKKYGVEKRLQVGIGRWWSKLEANRPQVEKIYDERNNTYKEREYTYEQLVAEDIRAIEVYNNMQHPNQKMYPGLTRWQVLCEKQNPDLHPVNKAMLYRYIGEMTKTSIRRNMYCIVRDTKFRLPSPELIERLAPRDCEVQAYYMPDSEGCISEVYVYQGDNFIATCDPINPYNEAQAEKTEADEQSYLEQSKYVSQFDAMIKREKIQKVRILPYDISTEKAEIVEIASATPIDDPDEFSFDIDYAQRAKQDL